METHTEEPRHWYPLFYERVLWLFYMPSVENWYTGPRFQVSSGGGSNSRPLDQHSTALPLDQVRRCDGTYSHNLFLYNIYQVEINQPVHQPINKLRISVLSIWSKFIDNLAQVSNSLDTDNTPNIAPAFIQIQVDYMFYHVDIGRIRLNGDYIEHFRWVAAYVDRWFYWGIHL